MKKSILISNLSLNLSKENWIVLSMFVAALFAFTSSSFAQTTTISYTGVVQGYTVPPGVTLINITASGAQGGNLTSPAGTPWPSPSATGGKGANMSGIFTVIPGHILNILVGQQSPTTQFNAGGGGATYVWDATTGTLLIAAGGGGGAVSEYPDPSINGIDAVTTANGTSGGGGTSGAGTSGNGATAVTGGYNYGGGGAGWLSNGAGGIGGCSGPASGGASPGNGGAGGSGSSGVAYGYGAYNWNGNGGYGGGGGGYGDCAWFGGGGGGGGYSGGAAGAQTGAYGMEPGGGGGSYNTGTGQANIAGVNIGNGQVVISIPCTSPTVPTISATANNFCGSGTTTLSIASGTLNNATAWTWYSGSCGGTLAGTGTSITVTDASTTNYYARGEGGCVTPGSCGNITVSVNPLPTVASITGNTTLSTTITTQLSDATGSGIWASGTPAVAGVVSGTGVVSGSGLGTGNISYTVTALGCSTTVTTNVTVNTPTTGINFDGVNDYVAIPNILSGGSFTIEYWMKTTATSLTGTQWWAGNGIVDAEVASVTNDYGTAILNNKIAFGIGLPDVTIQSVTTVNTGNWYHVAATWNQPTGAMTLYINGVQEATGTSGTTLRTAPPTIKFGATQTLVAYFNGTIDEVRLWNTVRTQAEIQASMNCDIPQQTNLEGYYRFDEGAPAGNNTPFEDVYDYSGNYNCGSIHNMALTGSTSNYETGAVGDCNPITLTEPVANTGTAIVCTGATTMLTNGVSGGTWSTSNTHVSLAGTATATVTITGVSSGTANLTYSLNCGIAVTTVTVNPVYSITATAGANGSISGPATVCSGTTPTYTITPATGYQVADVLVDGTTDLGAVTSYTFPSVTTGHIISATFSLICTTTFGATGAAQTYTVPAGVNIINVSVNGASGGAGVDVGAGSTPGNGGTVTTSLAVTPGQILNIYVGGQGGSPSASSAGVGGFNGGGSGGTGSGGGGGGSDIRIGGTDLANRVIAAGGGGGTQSYDNAGYTGGAGGGLTGGTGIGNDAADDAILAGSGGGGGTQTAGGAGGISSGANGASGVGGDGGDAFSEADGGGGGGGGGYYGGGGGSLNGDGGGGSSYISAALTTSAGTGCFVFTQGTNSGNGSITITVPAVLVTTVNPICQGGTTSPLGGSLSASATGATWSDNDAGGTFANNDGSTPGAATYTASASAPATVTLTLTSTGGSCGAASCSIVLTVNPNPTVSVTSVPAVCQGSTTLGLGGSFGGGATSATWSDGGAGGTFSSDNTTGLTPGATTYTASGSGSSVTLTLTTSGGSCSTTSTNTSLTVNPLPNLDPSSNVTICAGSPAVLIAASGMVSYSWNSPTGPVAGGTGSSVTVYPGSSTTYSITASNGTCSNTAAVFVSVNPLPAALVITETDNCNLTSTLSLVSSLAPGATVLWSDGQITNPDIVTAAATYTAQQILNGCYSPASNTVTTAPYTSPTLTIGVINNCDNTSTLSVVSGLVTGATINWSNGIYGTATSITVSFPANYTATQTDVADGCTASVPSNPVTAAPQTGPSVTVATTNAACVTGTNGTATANVILGTGAITTYVWSPSEAPVAAITGLTTGVYSVTVTDANGCTAGNSGTVGVDGTAGANLLANSDFSGGYTGFTSDYTSSESGCALSNAAAYQVGSAPCSGWSGVSADHTTGSGNMLLVNGAANDCDCACQGLAFGTMAFWRETGISVTPGTAYSFSYWAKDLTNAPDGSNPAHCALDDNDHALLVLYINGVKAGGTFTVAGYNTWFGNSVSWTAPAGVTTATIELRDTSNAWYYNDFAVDDISFSGTTPNTISVTPVVTNVSCNTANAGNSTNGIINLTVSGSTSPAYTYVWLPAGTAGNAAPATGLPIGTYSVTVTDGNNCAAMTSAIVGEPTAITYINVTAANISCNNGNGGTHNNGTATVNGATGGTGGLNYTWSNGELTNPATGLTGPAAYNVTITDANLCSTTGSATVGQPTAITYTSVTATNISCNNTNGGTHNNGTATVNGATGGTGGLNYAWSNGELTNPATGLTGPNTYNVTITDANSCTTTGSATVGQPTAMVFATTIDNVSCFGGYNGQVDANVSGGAPGYAYSWHTGGIGFAFYNDLYFAPAGAYSVTVTDANSCVLNGSFTVTQPAALALSATTANVSCHGGANGSITTTVTGGTTAYSYSWSSYIYGAAPTSLSAGTYYLTVNDAHGCSINGSYIITQPATLSVSGTVTNVSCHSGSNGAITTSVTGGTSSYAYLWSPGGAVTSSLTGKTSGTYNVTVTDAHSCTATGTYTIAQPAAALAVSATVANVNCFGGSTGSITTSVTGGTASYSYIWSPGGATSANLTGKAIGTYSVTVTDAHSCTTSGSYTITQPTASLAVTGTVTNVTCNGGDNGSIATTVTGGTASYSYAWSPCSGSSASLTGKTAGTYNVTVTDAHGCIAAGTYTITQPVALTCAIAVTPSTTCYTGGVPTTIYLGYGPQSATLAASATGGTGFSYSWSSTSGTGSLSNIHISNPVFTATLAGHYTYVVTITNSAGCSTSCSVSICVIDAVDHSHPGNILLCHAYECTPTTISCTPAQVLTHLPSHCPSDHLGAVGSGCTTSGRESGDDDEQPAVINELTVNAFPNPFNSAVNVKIQSSLMDNVDVKVYDVTGRVMETKPGQAVDSDIILGQNLVPGIYIIEVRQGEEMKKVKVVKY